MRIGGGGSQDTNQLFSDSAQYRNQDLVVRAAGAFWGGNIQGATLGERSYIQLQNPAASGVVVLVDGFAYTTDTAGLVRVSRYTGTLGGSSAVWPNRRYGAAAGNGLVIIDDQAALLNLESFPSYVLASVPVILQLDYPVELDEGESLLIGTNNNDVILTASFWGREL